MWHRHVRRTIGWFCPCSSRCKDLRGQTQMDRKITLGTMCTCKGMRHCEEEHANIECESWDHGAKEELGWQAGNQNPRSPQSPENGYIYCNLTKLCLILSCVQNPVAVLLVFTWVWTSSSTFLSEYYMWRRHSFAIFGLLLSLPLHIYTRA